MSVTELKTKILTAFENEIRVSFLLIVMYHVMNTHVNFKVPMKRIFFSQKYIHLGAENRKIAKKLSTKVLKRNSRVSKFPNLP